MEVKRTIPGGGVMSITTRVEEILDRDRLSPRLAVFPWVLFRIGLSVILTSFIGTAALAAVFVGFVSITGCFLTCDDPNVLAGVPLLFLAAFLGALGLGTFWWGLVDSYWRTAIKVLTVLAIGGALLLVGLGLSA